ncbi:MAG: Asp23/Gls24 family envelope stress response protein [Oscillospiraceae bacterium]|nr:Asp23/Gls24 family envelope stress response protein [Oscillospiraceae bacterium]
MIKINNYLGYIEIHNEYFSNLIAKNVSECFGVKGMVNGSTTQKLRSFISKSDSKDKGVVVKSVDEKLIVDIHIEVSYGVNISAIVKSIISKVRYAVEESTGLIVSKVNVYVDSISV